MCVCVRERESTTYALAGLPGQVDCAPNVNWVPEPLARDTLSHASIRPKWCGVKGGRMASKVAACALAAEWGVTWREQGRRSPSSHTHTHSHSLTHSLIHSRSYSLRDAEVRDRTHTLSHISHTLSPSLAQGRKSSRSQQETLL